MTSASTGNSEQWRPVRGYEGCYEVSSEGRVRSLVAKQPGLLLRPYRRADGYMQVQLKVGQEARNFLVHVLVDEAFNGPCPAALERNHRDGDKGNNRLGNLERVSHVENVRHAFREGLCGSREGEANAFAKLTEVQVRSIRSEAEASRYPSGRIRRGVLRDMAARYGVSSVTIGKVIRGAAWSHIA
ncbi:NUMOD4 motif-containing HNH endonuclease [Cupriavidus gilardii]|uniref:NUMOD4 motif-containing HNH endonuclease n=1 Tax=Cupriavidus gilardii TaxID=82541 RepID=UPI0024053247|nr:NUMOD4 motif-containing HNH endonuclease [Cupriavidus gilardii]